MIEYKCKCIDCKFSEVPANVSPCSSCGLRYKNYMPAVKTPKDEVNHPSRYKGGKYECIDIMLDVFGVAAVKSFCILNAFKYIWRHEHKNGVEDIKKAVWYLNKFVELSEGEREVKK